jgi:hypothetical protein
LFFICCICAIVLLNKIDKKMFQKKFFHWSIFFSENNRLRRFGVKRQWGSCSSSMFLVDQHDLRKTKIQFHGGKNSLRTFFR